MDLKIDQNIAPYPVTARNYGADHANKIHSDEGAAEYGFEGALVPGVAVYAYLTRPVVDTLGLDWLAWGTASAKFLKPVYDAEKVRVTARVTGLDPVRMNLELENEKGAICAIGTVGLPGPAPPLDPKRYPFRALPDADRKRPATIDAIKPGEIFGSLNFILDLQGEVAMFLDDVVDDSPIYRGREAVCHPAYWISQANEMIMHNVELGPWIHTASEIRHYDLARHGEKLSLRGSVTGSQERRGHELITVDLGLFGEGERPIAQITHTAIIRIRGTGNGRGE